jgi:hypothetical protein
VFIRDGPGSDIAVPEILHCPVRAGGLVTQEVRQEVSVLWNRSNHPVVRFIQLPVEDAEVL